MITGPNAPESGSFPPGPFAPARSGPAPGSAGSSGIPESRFKSANAVYSSYHTKEILTHPDSLRPSAATNRITDFA